MSGAYIARNDRQVFLLQVVQAGGDRLTGTLQVASITPSGSFQSGTVAVSGARDGRNVVLNVTQNGLEHFFVGSVSLSGIIVGSDLTVEGGSSDFSLNLRLSAGDLATYENWVSALRRRSVAILAARAAAARRQQMLAAAAASQAAARARQQAAQTAARNLNHAATVEVGIIRRSHAPIQARIAYLYAAAAKLRADTTRMADLVRTEDGAGGYLGRYGNQVATSVQQAEFRNDQAVSALRNHLVTVQRSGIIALLRRVKATDAACGHLISTAGTVTNAGEEEAGCTNLAKVTPGLVAEVSRLVTAYRGVFSTWAAERPRQEALVSQAFR